MIRERFFRAFALLTFLFALTSAGFSQGTTTRITGIVTDSAGDPVTGATVKIRREGTRVDLTTQTADNGQYVFDLIQPGVYEVSVEKAGFKKFVSTNNPANLNLPATVNVSLEVGDVSATVTVQGAAEQVQTSTSGNVGSTIDQRMTESLPIVGLRGRNPLDLLNFQPGVLVGSNTGGGVHVNGSRDRAFNFTLDGIDINESTAGGSNFTPLRPNPDSIQEFQIITSNATAEQGRSSGAQVTLVTKPGTNEFHGNLFEYYQTPRFLANEFENNLLRVPRRQFVQHIYGGSFGGPIPTFGLGEGENFKLLKDKAFFFVNLQKLYATESRLAQRTVYTQSARSGIFRSVFGGALIGTPALFVPGRNAPAGVAASSTNPLGASVTSSGAAVYPACVGTPPTNAPCTQSYNVVTNLPVPLTTDPFILNLLNSYPLPNDFTRGDGLNTAGFNFNALQLEKQYDFVTRIDYRFNDNNAVYFRYAKGEQNTLGDSVNGGLPPFPGFPNLVNTLRTPDNTAINYRWSPTPKLTNEFIFGLSRFGFSFATEEPNPLVPFVLNSVTDAYTNFAYNARRARTIQFVDNVTMDFSPHLLKAGVNLRFGRQVDDRSSAGGVIEGTVGFGTGSSSFTGFSLPALAVAGTMTTPGGTPGIFSADRSLLQAQINNFLGRIGSFSQGFVVSPSNPNAFAPAGTRWAWTAEYPELDFYFQDTWRMRPNFTVDLGIRYEVKLSPTSPDLPILRATQPFVVGAPATNALSWTEGKLFENDYNNYSPSIGFAWDPFGSGKTSIRANYRLSYDRFPSQVFANSIFQSAPGNTFAATASGIGSSNLLIRNGLPNLFPTQTPAQLRTPPAFSTGAITVLDPDMRYPEVHQWYAGFQREIGFGSVLELNYIGKKGIHLFGGYDSNQVNILGRDPRCPRNFLESFNQIRNSGSTSECLINLLFTGDPANSAGTTTFRGITAVQTTLLANNTGGSVANAALAVSQHTTSGAQTIGRAAFFNNPFFFQRFPQYTGALNVLDTNDYSFYNGFEAILKRRMNNGIAFQLGYTLSKSMDTRSFDPTFTIVSRANNQSASSTPFDINNRKLNYAWSDFDRRHAIQATYVAELPFGRGRRFGSDISKGLDYLIGGWQLAGTFNWASGRPFTVYSGLNTFSNVNQSFANCNGCSRNMGDLTERNGTWYWFSAEQEAMFSQPTPGDMGNTGRNFFIAPRQFQKNMSLSKKFRFSERYSFDLRVDSLNLTNTPSFGLPTATQNSQFFGRIRDSVTSLARRIQFSGKFNF